MIWRSLQFDWPSAAVLFAIVILIGSAGFFLYRYRQRKLHEFASQSVLEVVEEKREPLIYWLKVFLFCLAWVCGIFALMQPKGNERYLSTASGGQIAAAKKPPEETRLRKNTHEVIFLVDASASMQIVDVSNKSRLDVAKEIADDVVRHLQGENVSLYAFTSSTIQIVPSTLDYLFTRMLLQQIQINESETEGTDIKQALEYLKKLYFAKGSSKAKTLIVLSDGGDTRLQGLTGEMRQRAISDIISPVEDAREKKVRILTVGIASAKGKEVPGMNFRGHPVISALEEPLLSKLSNAGDGELFIVGEMSPLDISQALSQKIARDESFVDVDADLQLPDMGEGTQIYDYYFQFPLGAAIVALIGCLLIPDTRKKIGKGRGM
jgi:Ca-activated chloride channel homolog